MAVSEQTPYSEHTGNGVTTSFALGFQCESKDHLIVLVDEIEPPIETWSLIDGNVIFTTAPAAGKKITLQRNTPFSRNTDYQTYNNSFRPQPVNKDFDRIWLKLQELGHRDQLIWLALVKEIADRIAGDKNLQNQINAIDSWLEDLQKNVNENTSDIEQLVNDLSKEIADRITNDLILKDMFLTIIDTAINEGTVNALAITHVDSIEALNAVTNLWGGRIIYVKDIGNYRYDSFIKKWVYVQYLKKNSPYFYGAVNNKTVDSSDALQRMIDSGQLSFDLEGGEFGVSKMFETKYPYTQIRNGRIYVLDDFPDDQWCALGVGASYNTFEDLWCDCNGTVSAGFFSGIDAEKGKNGVTNCKSFIGALGIAHHTKVSRCYGTRSQGGSPVFAFGGIDQCLYTKIIDCTAEFTGSMFFTQSAHNEVINPTCINCNDAGIAFNTGGGKFGKVTGGTVSNCRYGGIAVESNSHNVDIFGVTFRQPATNSVMQKGDVLFSSFAAGESPCYQSSVSACKFYIDGTWSGDNNAYTYGIRLEGANNISISNNDLYCGDQGAYTGSHHALVFAQLDLYSVTDIKIQGNRINRGQTLKIFKSDTSVNYGLNNIFIKDNIIDTTANTIYFPTGNTSTYPMGGGTVGILVEGNTFVKTGQKLVEGSTYAMNNCGVGLVFGRNTYLNQAPRSLMLWDRYVYTSSYYEPYSFGKVADEFGRFISDTVPTRGFWKQGDLIYKSSIDSTTQVIGWQCVVGGFFPTLGWAANTRFELDQVVYNNNKSYVCVKEGTSGTTFTEADNELMSIASDGVCSWKYVGSGTPQFIELRNTQSIQSVSQDVNSVSIPADSSITVTFVYSEARSGDKLFATYSNDIGMLTMNVWCSAPNNVTVRFTNNTTAAITLSAGTVIVHKII